jgi:anti-sigma-K factor RskA
MSDKGRDRDTLAAEYALGVLGGEERRDASARASSDPAFAQEIARWRGRLAPLADAEPLDPPAGLWPRIDAAIAPRSGGNVMQLRRKVTIWQAATAGMTALAASLGLVLLQQPRTIAPLAGPPAAATPMVAMLGNDQKQMKVVASWDPASRQLVLAVPGDMPADPAHAHQLWVIPSGGKPTSLGTMPSSNKMHMQLADALARLLQQGATIAISVEPPGGSPTGAPTGPVVVSGSLDRA